MKLERLLDGVEYKLVEGDIDLDISGIEHDSRKIKEGNLFVAIEGFTVDGYDYIDRAVENGAQAIVFSKDRVPELEGISLIKIEDDKEVLAQISSNFFENPSSKLDLIGITGTNGKTSITYMLKSILEAGNKKVGLIGTMGSIIDDRKVDNANTTPESLEIQSQIKRMVDVGTDFCLMEVSSHSLDMKRVESLEFDVGIFTNLTEDHLDYHLNMENYFSSKKKLFYKTKKLNIINLDDEYGKQLVEGLGSNSHTPLITYGLDSGADIYAQNINCHNKGVNYTLTTKDGQVDIEMNLLGEFNVYNSLAAAAVAIDYGYELETIKSGLEKLVGIRGRFELVPTDEDYSVIIDFAHTPDGLEQVLKTVEGFSKGRTIVVFGAGGNRDKIKRPIMGETVGLHADIPLVTSDNPRFEDPEEIISDILEGVKKVNKNYVSIVDRKEAIAYAIDIAEPGDTIVLAGKGHETYIQIGGKTLPFDEREIVLELIREREEKRNEVQ